MIGHYSAVNRNKLHATTQVILSNHYTYEKQPDIKEYILCTFICMPSKKEGKLIMMIENKPY